MKAIELTKASVLTVGLLKSQGHKFNHGHALVLSGPATQTGAARLAARGALRIGAGLVTLGAHETALAENAAHLTAIMLRQIDGAADLDEVLQDERISSVCIGPGFGLTAREADMLGIALSSGRPTILDADALTLLAGDKALFGKLHSDCVLTPHGGEFGRLFPNIAARLRADAAQGSIQLKVDAACDAARRAGCTVLFKGEETVIASPDGTCAINASQNDRSAPWLATAGSGDVLAGYIAGLMARGILPKQAAEAAAWLHTECALSFGPGLIAEDLSEELPKVLRRLKD